MSANIPAISSCPPGCLAANHPDAVAPLSLIEITVREIINKNRAFLGNQQEPRTAPDHEKKIPMSAVPNIGDTPEVKKLVNIPVDKFTVDVLAKDLLELAQFCRLPAIVDTLLQDFKESDDKIAAVQTVQSLQDLFFLSIRAQRMILTNVSIAIDSENGRHFAALTGIYDRPRGPVVEGRSIRMALIVAEDAEHALHAVKMQDIFDSNKSKLKSFFPTVDL